MPSGMCGCCSKSRAAVLEGETIDGEDAFTRLFGFIWDAEKDDFNGDSREVNRAIWEEYRTFSNPDLNERAAAINAEKKLKMEAKQLAPYDEYLAHHGLTWPCVRSMGSGSPPSGVFPMASRPMAMTRSASRCMAIRVLLAA